MTLPVVMTALGVPAMRIPKWGLVDRAAYLFTFTNTPTEISLEISPGVLGVGALIGLTTRSSGVTGAAGLLPLCRLLIRGCVAEHPSPSTTHVGDAECVLLILGGHIGALPEGEVGRHV